MLKEKIYYTKDILKLEIAQQLGYGHKIHGSDWGDLTSAESGRVGGLVTRYMRQHKWI